MVVDFQGDRGEDPPGLPLQKQDEVCYLGLFGPRQSDVRRSLGSTPSRPRSRPGVREVRSHVKVPSVEVYVLEDSPTFDRRDRLTLPPSVTSRLTHDNLGFPLPYLVFVELSLYPNNMFSQTPPPRGHSRPRGEGEYPTPSISGSVLSGP